MTYDEALDYMQGLRRLGIKLGNQRFSVLLSRLGNPHVGYGIAHVAGTKGKGSTTAMIAAILKAHGFRTGGYYSPYVYDVRERVQVNGEMISREEFARIVTAIRPVAEKLARTELGPTTEFELKTAVGFRHFGERKVDFAAVEVGIGGRLDATNVVEPLVTVITNIGLDHTQMLGDTHAKIAFEKAGILKPGIPCITAAEEPSALEVIERTAGERGAPLLQVREAGAELERINAARRITWQAQGDRFAVTTPYRRYEDLTTGLQGAYQRINAACAVGAVEQLAITRRFDMDLDAVREGLRLAYLPGRMEVVHERPAVILDGAHNAMAAEALAAEIRKRSYDRLLLVVGVLSGHEPSGILGALAPMATAVYATQPGWTRALPAEEVAEAARAHCDQVTIVTPPLEAARAALADAGPDDLVLITGSFYTVGDVPVDRLLSSAPP